MDTVGIITSAIEGSLRDMGYEIVRILLSGKEKKHLQIMIDNIDGTPITVEDCVKASDSISVILDVEDPIPENYDLEVSSAGLDRPMMKLKDYVRFCGSKVNMKLYDEVLGRKSLKGTIIEADADKDIIVIKLLENNDEYEVDFSNIRKANLIPEIDFKK